jgi:hypothetical protein
MAHAARAASRFVYPIWALALAACTGPGAMNLGGTLTGLNPGASVTLRNVNQSDDLTLTQNGEFRFGKYVPPDTPYDVEVVTQPTGQTCTVANGNNTMSDSANLIDNIEVTCVATQ